REALIQAGSAVAATAFAARGENAEPPGTVAFAAVQIPDWVHDITRMTFCTPGEVAKAARIGAQVIHTNIVWPYFPLRRGGGGLSKQDEAKLRALVADCRRAGLKLVLGLPPFPPVALV